MSVNANSDIVQTYNPEDTTRGLSKRECQNCGKYGHEHDKERVERGGSRYGYDLVCPTDGGGGE